MAGVPVIQCLGDHICPEIVYGIGSRSNYVKTGIYNGIANFCGNCKGVSAHRVMVAGKHRVLADHSHIRRLYFTLYIRIYAVIVPGTGF